MRTVLLPLSALAVSLTVVPAASLACSPIPNYRPPSAAELERGAIEGFGRAAAVVEVVAETGSAYPRPGRMRVLRVYRGSMRVGTRLSVGSVPGSMCGAGEFSAGARGIMMIHSPGSTLTYQGFIAPAHVAALRREGLLPER